MDTHQLCKQFSGVNLVTENKQEKLETQKTSVSFEGAFMPFVGIGGSLGVCYSKAMAAEVLPLFGMQLEIDPNAQALAMWVFSLIAVVAIYNDRERHGNLRPFYYAIAGLLILVGTLYIYWDVRVLFSSYYLMFTAAFKNQNSILKKLNSQIQAQSDDLTEWNKSLENRVSSQVAELDRVGKLKRFLAPEIANLVVAQVDSEMLSSHRCYVAAIFCDLRGFTAFSDNAEPEEVMEVLQDYHQALGKLVAEKGGTISHRAGDGLLIIFNDPIKCNEPVRCGIELAFAAQEIVSRLAIGWSKRGFELGMGVGVASGYATLGIIGDECRSDYTAIGNVVNLSSRLCDEAASGEVLICKRAYLDVEEFIEVEVLSGLKLKGLSRFQEAYKVLSVST